MWSELPNRLRTTNNFWEKYADLYQPATLERIRSGAGNHCDAIPGGTARVGSPTAPGRESLRHRGPYRDADRALPSLSNR